LGAAIGVIVCGFGVVVPLEDCAGDDADVEFFGKGLVPLEIRFPVVA
jgi:hypothetical protein